MKRATIFIIALMLTWINLAAQVVLSDSAYISLLTCWPGEQIYVKFGHSAIRVCDKVNNIDVVFNYGVFSFNEDNFILHFVAGETDYQLATQSYQRFDYSYRAEGRKVYEQVLNLDSTMRQQLFDKLCINAMPENRVYRYNFIFDNCATRPYAMLDSIFSGQLSKQCTPDFDDAITFRQAITHYTHTNSWGQFGIDLCFGTEADQIMTPEQYLFLPERLMVHIAQATINGNKLTLQNKSPEFTIEKTNFMTSPLLLLLFIAGLLVFYCSYCVLQTKKPAFFTDAVLYLISALIGTLLFYLAFFSVHAFVSRNFNLIILSPLAWIPFFMTLSRKTRLWLSKSQKVLLIYDCLALIIYLISPQRHMLVFFMFGAFGILHLSRIILSKGKNNVKIASIAALLIFAGTSQNASAQQKQHLTVLVAVEGLNNYGVKHYWNQNYNNLILQHKVYGGTESLVTLLTGVNPNAHGIVHDLKYDKVAHKIVGTLADRKQEGIGTTETLSPVNILAPTVTDMLKMANRLNKVYAIGIKGKYTLALAGHSANAAMWLNTNNLQWAASPYYSEGLPKAAYEMNVNKDIEQIIQDFWRPTLDSITKYDFTSEREYADHGFAYYTNVVQKDGTHIFSQTPVANKIILDMALKMQEDKKLGEYTNDMLCLQLTATTPAANSDRIATAEQQDMYIKMAEQLDSFSIALNRQFTGHVDIIVFGIPYKGEQPSEYEKAGVPFGDFNIERAAALVNTYLMALYGHHKWIEGGHINTLFFNKEVLAEQKLNYNDVTQQVAHFIENFEGVSHAYTKEQIMSAENDNNVIGNIKNSASKDFCGDIFVTLQKGWRITNNSTVIDRYAQNNVSCPVIYWNNGFSNINFATDLAPQIANILNIQYIR